MHVLEFSPSTHSMGGEGRWRKREGEKWREREQKEGGGRELSWEREREKEIKKNNRCRLWTSPGIHTP